MSLELSFEQKQELLKLARKSITFYLDQNKLFEPELGDPRLKEPSGVFVTLHKSGQLRGCLGSIVAKKPLYLAVRDMAISAASEDPRFSRLTSLELEDIDIEISVLSSLERVTDPEQIIIGTHGVLIKQGFQSGVYLPQVGIETGWSRNKFMDSLCEQKAGIAKDAWQKGACEIYTFTAEVFGEK